MVFGTTAADGRDKSKIQTIAMHVVCWTWTWAVWNSGDHYAPWMASMSRMTPLVLQSR